MYSLFGFQKLKFEVGDKQDEEKRDMKVYQSNAQIDRLAKREQQMEAFVYNWEKTPLFVVPWTSMYAAFLTFYWTLFHQWNFLSIENYSAWFFNLFALSLLLVYGL